MKTQIDIPDHIIENLKNRFQEKYLKDFDDLDKVKMVCIASELFEKDKSEKMAEFIHWSMRHWETGNLASKLNFLIQNQNMGLIYENQKLKTEVKKLTETLEWK